MCENKKSSKRAIAGYILIALGIIFLLDELLGISLLNSLWPVAIIAVGVYMLYTDKEKTAEKEAPAEQETLKEEEKK
jgi:uncharacterized membrane protein